MKKLFCLTWLAFSSYANADFGISLYGGWQASPRSVVKGIHPDTQASFENTFHWQTKSFSSPPYYGIKLSYLDNDLTTQLEFTHAKVYTTPTDRNAVGFSHFEFTDGLA